MGCENSKTVRVQPVGPVSNSRDNTQLVLGKEGTTQTPEAKHNQHKRRPSTKDNDSVEYRLDEHGNKVKSRKRRPRSPTTQDLMGSCDTLDDGRSLASDRGCSATSKQSADSGLGEEYAHVITEYSEESEVRKVETVFKPRDDLDLSVTGVQCSTRNSAKDRARLEEAHIMQSLREEGLITRPQVKATGGMCFEIVSAAGGMGDGVPKPPPRLEKLALERGRKKKRALTEDQIREKLDRAERRRKKREQERLEKIRELEHTDAVAALENFVQYQMNKEESIAKRMDQVHDNRERKLRELKEKQERRKRHAEMVRKRKALAAESGTHEASYQDESQTPQMTPRPEMTTTAEASALKVPVQTEDSENRTGSRNSSRSSTRSRQ